MNIVIGQYNSSGVVNQTNIQIIWLFSENFIIVFTSQLFLFRVFPFRLDIYK